MTNPSPRLPSSSIALLLLLGCAGATAAPAEPVAPKPRCGPGGPAGTRCGPPNPPPAPMTALAPATVISMVSYEAPGGLVRASLVHGASGDETIVVEQFKADTLAAQTVLAIDGATVRAEYIRGLRWDGTDLKFSLGTTDRDLQICHVKDAATGATVPACVVARGGSRPMTR